MPPEIDEDLPEGDTFPREYVEKLRAEAAKYRTALRPFEQAFGDFNDQEKDFLFGMLQNLNADPQKGAVMFRDMAKNILQDDFYKDLDDLPTAEAPAPEKDGEEEESPEPKKEDPVSLTPEQLKEELDRREAEAAREAAVEQVFAEIEEQGFTRGTAEFRTALTLAHTLTQEGKEVDFAELAPKVRMFHDIPEPSADDDNAEESSNEDTASAETTATATEEPTPEFPKTAGAGGNGAAAEPPTDWIAEAKAAGKSPMEAARERMEARLGDD